MLLFTSVPSDCRYVAGESFSLHFGLVKSFLQEIGMKSLAFGTCPL